MLMYNWNTMFAAANGSPVEVCRILRMIVTNQIPRNLHDPIMPYVGKSFLGESFLVHPDMLVYNMYQYPHKDIVQYLALASLRPLADYLATGLITVPSDDTGIEPELLDYYILTNGLLGTKEGNIGFRYEEMSKQTVH
jgi:hypothetical protein